MVVVLTFDIKMKGSKNIMYKFILLTITVGGFVFSGSWNNAVKSDEASNPVKNQYCWAEDTSSDDSKIEAGRRRGKGNKGRRRGGSGLR